jgi:hypothetical protein
MSGIPKPKVSEYAHSFETGQCTSWITLIAREIRYVNETPSIKWWWEEIILPADHESSQCPYAHRDKIWKGETHNNNCHPDFPDKSKKNAWCGLAKDHDGPHMSEIGICDDNLSKDIWISWETGEHDSRGLKQPGLCSAEKTPNDSEFFCILAEGHGGKHRISEGFVSENWELINELTK